MKKKYFKKTVLLIAAIIMLVIIAQPKLWSLITGGTIVFMGELIRVWATGHLKRNQEVTTSGPYAHLRDPLYLGRFFLLVGFCVMAGAYAFLFFFLSGFVCLHTVTCRANTGKKWQDLSDGLAKNTSSMLLTAGV